MPQLDSASPEVQRINRAIANWRQGDVSLGRHWFMHVADPAKALTTQSGQAQGDVQPIISEAAGLVVVSQSCDIVRSCLERPFLEIAPLLEAAPPNFEQVRKGLRPRFAFVPAIADRKLVADLDQIMTVEKAVVATWDRTPGCRSDSERRIFAQALARKRVRFAFPDDFTRFASGLIDRLQEKHDKLTREGSALRALREIRVTAAPSWDATTIDLFFWFIRDDTEPDSGETSWPTMCQAWLKLVPPGGRFSTVDGQAVFLEDLTAKDYVESDPLDLDHLSTAVDLAT